MSIRSCFNVCTEINTLYLQNKHLLPRKWIPHTYKSKGIKLSKHLPDLPHLTEVLVAKNSSAVWIAELPNLWSMPVMTISRAVLVCFEKRNRQWFLRQEFIRPLQNTRWTIDHNAQWYLSKCKLNTFLCCNWLFFVDK